MNWPLLWGGLVTYVKKSLAGLGALKGSPAKVKSVTPTYSTLDPTVIIKNEVKLQWDSNESRDPTQPPAWTETSFFTVDNGRQVYKIEEDKTKSTETDLYYVVTYYDGTTGSFLIPRDFGGLKRKVVTTLPDPALADKSTIYMVEDPASPGNYNQYISTYDTATASYQWLSLGSTATDLTAYLKKIDATVINRTDYPNPDPATKTTQPTAASAPGAINEFQTMISNTAKYDYTNGKINELTTHTKTNLIGAINEMGNLEDLEMWDATTQTPATLVDAINITHATYDVETKTTIDRTKYIKQQQVTKDNHDGSAKIDVGDVININRVDVEKRATPESSTSYVDYRTYDVKVAGNLYDPDDTTQAVFGQVHIPQIKIKKESPVLDDVTDTITITAWTQTMPSDYEAEVTLTHVPVVDTFTPVVTLSPACTGSVSLATTAGVKTATVKILGATTVPSAPCVATIVYKGESTSIAARYYLQIEGKDYEQAVSGSMIEIGKDAFLNGASVKVCTEEGKPLPELHVGD